MVPIVPCPDAAYRGPLLVPGLGARHDGEHLVVGPLPTGYDRAEPERGDVGPPSRGLTTYKRSQKGQVQRVLGGGQRQGP